MENPGPVLKHFTSSDGSQDGKQVWQSPGKPSEHTDPHALPKIHLTNQGTWNSHCFKVSCLNVDVVLWLPKLSCSFFQKKTFFFRIISFKSFHTPKYIPSHKKTKTKNKNQPFIGDSDVQWTSEPLSIYYLLKKNFLWPLSNNPLVGIT